MYSPEEIYYHLNALCINVELQPIRDQYALVMKRARRRGLHKKYGEHFRRYVYCKTINRIVKITR